MADEAQSGPLAGVKVLEITTMVAGPLAGTMLADLGASVTKVEGMAGDPMRVPRPQYKDMCAHFFAVNRGKRSVQLDLKSPEGRAVAQALAAEADVMLVNTRPAVMTRLGLDYETLKQSNPGLIYVMVSGFGPEGPYSDRPAYDQVIQALSGAMYLQNPEGEPTPLRSMFIDKFTATAAASAVSSALYYRERSGGEGQFISVPLLKAFGFLSVVDNLHNYCFVEGEETTPFYNVVRPFKSSDGTFMGFFQTDQQFVQIAKALGVEHLLQDERFTSLVLRVSNWEELWVELEKGSSKFTSDELEALALSQGLPIARVNSIEDFINDPQSKFLGCVEQYDTEEYGQVRAAGHPVDFAKTPARVGGVPPRLGQHTEEVLRELGYNDERIGNLRASGAVR